MAGIKELLRSEEDGTLSFGDYELVSKTKLSDFEFKGDIYKVKTYKDITRLEKNDAFVYESVPGTAVSHLDLKSDEVHFIAEGPSDAQLTLELEDETPYEVVLNGASAGIINTKLGGKLTFGIELTKDVPVEVEIKKA